MGLPRRSNKKNLFINKAQLTAMNTAIESSKQNTHVMLPGASENTSQLKRWALLNQKHAACSQLMSQSHAAFGITKSKTDCTQSDGLCLKMLTSMCSSWHCCHFNLIKINVTVDKAMHDDSNQKCAVRMKCSAKMTCWRDEKQGKVTRAHLLLPGGVAHFALEQSALCRSKASISPPP